MNLTKAVAMLAGSGGTLMLEPQRFALLEQRRKQQQEHLQRRIEEEERLGRELQRQWDERARERARERAGLTAEELLEREGQVAAHLRHHAELQLLQLRWQQVQEQQALLQQQTAEAAAAAPAALATAPACEAVRAEHFKRQLRAPPGPTPALLQLRRFHEEQLQYERDRLLAAVEQTVAQAAAGEAVDVGRRHGESATGRIHHQRHRRSSHHHNVEFRSPAAMQARAPPAGASPSFSHARRMRRCSDNAPKMAPLLPAPHLPNSSGGKIAGAFGTCSLLSNRARAGPRALGSTGDLRPAVQKELGRQGYAHQSPAGGTADGIGEDIGPDRDALGGPARGQSADIPRRSADCEVGHDQERILEVSRGLSRGSLSPARFSSARSSLCSSYGSECTDDGSPARPAHIARTPAPRSGERARAKRPKSRDHHLDVRRNIARSRWLVAYSMAKNALRAEAAARDGEAEVAAIKRATTLQRWKVGVRKSCANLAQARLCSAPLGSSCPR